MHRSPRQHTPRVILGFLLTILLTASVLFAFAALVIEDPAVEAAQRGASGAVQRFIVAGHNPNAATRDGKWSLLGAVIAFDPSDTNVRLLLEHGADPSRVMSDGEYPLTLAVRGARLAVVKLLMNHGADPNVQDPYGDGPPVFAAILEDRPEIITALAAGGARLDVTNRSGETPLRYARRLGQRKIAALLNKLMRGTRHEPSRALSA